MKRLLLSITFLSFLFIGSKNIHAQPLPPGNTLPVITEIMYNPPETGNDTLEFIELLNPSLTAAINMGGYYFSSGVDFTFPSGFVLPAGEHVIVAGDSVIFETWFGMEAFEWEGQASGLSNSGEGITLRTSTGVVADTVFFDDAVAWPQEADGAGYSLTLCDPSADNNLPASWTASENATGIIVNSLEVFADPGQLSTCTATGIVDDNVITTLVYPNPSNGEFRLQMEALTETARLNIYNNAGQVVATRSLAEGTTTVTVAETLAVGYYTLAIERSDATERIKLIIE
jgi:hypothetical protein